MTNKKDLIIAVLVTFCLTSVLFMMMPTRSETPPGTYDPWVDLNEDGTVDILDAIILSNHFLTSGTSIAKSSLLYDSEWVNITDKAGQDIVFSHGLGMLNWNDGNITVEITGKTTPDSDLLRHLGLLEQEGWNKTYGGVDTDCASSIVQAADGGYAIAGSGFADFVKIDAEGNLSWYKSYGFAQGLCNEYSYLRSVIQTSDGGYAMTGASGDFDFLLVKTDELGNMQWNKTYGGTGSEVATSLVQTSDGGYAIAGATNSLGAGYADFWLVKTDSNGIAQWNKTYGDIWPDYAYSVAQTSDEGYVVAGCIEIMTGPGDQFWLVKTDMLGNMQWNRTYGDEGYDYCYCVIETADGGYAMAGDSWAGGARDALLVKTDALGNMQWNRTYGGDNYDFARSVVETSHGYTLGGYTRSYGSDDQFWLVRADELGNMQWNKTYVVGLEDHAYSLVKTDDGGYALAGYTLLSSFEMWVVKTDFQGNAFSSFKFGGLVWRDSTADTITLYRDSTDPCWNFVRVRIWKTKTP